MTNDGRRTRFQARIKTERAILTLVNRHLGSVAPLHGMTKSAIDTWRTTAEGVLSGPDLEALKRALLEIGRKAELLADNSRDVFEEIDLAPAASIDQLKAILALMLRDLSQVSPLPSM